jgi:quinol monooxygenase YgiN
LEELFSAFRGWRSALIGSILIAMAVGPGAQAQTRGGAVYAATYIDVGINSVAQGVALLKRYRDASQAEPGNVEFAILQETTRPNRFVMFEGWKDQGAEDVHFNGHATLEFENSLAPIRNSPLFRMADYHEFSTNIMQGKANHGAIYVVEHLDINSAVANSAAFLVKAFTETSRKEAGIIRYDTYLSGDHHYTIMGVWRDSKAYNAHERSTYARQFRAATAMPMQFNLYDPRFYQPF